MSLGNPMKPIISSAHSRGPRQTARRLSDLAPHAWLDVPSRRSAWIQIADQLAVGLIVGVVVGIVVMLVVSVAP